jgi:predicted dehydrogenase
MNCLIIGAGQLGSRHLQGLLSLKQEQVIYVLDLSSAAIKIAKERAKEINHSHDIIFISDWDKLPEEFNLVIVATGANVREEVVTHLLERCVVHNLILEKILFQDLEAYDKILNLLEKTNTPTWVNHPRRMLSHFQEIKKTIAKSNEIMTFHVMGGSWGLACNGLHFIDLCAFLVDSTVETIDMDWIDGNIHESKRPNCIEFTGSVKGRMKDESNFLITSLDGELVEVTIFISTTSNRWIIQEGRAQKIIHLSKENNFNPAISSFITEFQSSLTTNIAKDIFESNSSKLPTYKEASASHIPFIEASLAKYREITGIETNICPIT